MTMNLTDSIAGPPHPLEGLSAQNAVSFVGTTTGTVAEQHDPRQQCIKRPAPRLRELFAHQRHGHAAV